MTYEEGCVYGQGAVILQNGKIGMLIRFHEDKAGVQIPGDENITFVSWEDVKEYNPISLFVKAAYRNS